MKIQTPFFIATVFAFSFITGCFTDSISNSSELSSSSVQSSVSSSSLSESSSSEQGTENSADISELFAGNELDALFSGDLSAMTDSSVLDAEVATAVVGYREGTVDSTELAQTLEPVVDSALTVALDSMGYDVPPLVQDMLSQMLVETAVSCLGEDSLPDLTQMSEDSLATPDCIDPSLMMMLQGLSGN